MRKLQSGFTLLEMLFVLGIATSMAVLRIADMRVDVEQNKAKRLGVEIYQYNNAVRSYISDHIGATTDPAPGVDWLKSAACGGSAAKDYLPCGFPETVTFGVGFDTNIYVDGSGFTVAETVVDPVIDDDGTRSDLSGLAALIAAGGGVNYMLPVFAATDARFSSDRETATITMTASTNANTDAWLRTDGANDMDNNVVFNAASPQSQREIQNVSRISALAAESLLIDSEKVIVSGVLVSSKFRTDEMLGHLQNPYNSSQGFNPDDPAQLQTGDALVSHNLYVDDKVVIGNLNPATLADVEFQDLAVGKDAFVEDNLIVGNINPSDLGIGISTMDQLPSGDAAIQRDLHVRGTARINREIRLNNNQALTGRVEVEVDGNGAHNVYILRHQVDLSQDPNARPWTVFESSVFRDSDDGNYVLDPNWWSTLKWVRTTERAMFGTCNLGNMETDCTENAVSGTSSTGSVGSVGSGSWGEMGGSPAKAMGFLDVDNLYIRKWQYYLNGSQAQIPGGLDLVNGDPNARRWKWVSLSRLLPNWVHMATHLVEDHVDPDTGLFNHNPALLTVPKPACGPNGTPKIILTPIRMSVNIQTGETYSEATIDPDTGDTVLTSGMRLIDLCYTNGYGNCQPYASALERLVQRGGFILKAETSPPQAPGDPIPPTWSVTMGPAVWFNLSSSRGTYQWPEELEDFRDFGIDSSALAQTYCYYGQE